MAALQGTIVGGAVVPGNSDLDVFPTHYDWLGNGGWRAVATIAKRDSITAERRALGMRVYVIDENKTYKLTSGLQNANWELTSEIVSAADSPAPTSEVWKGTQAQFKAIYSTGINPSVLYLFIKEKQVVRAPAIPVSFILTMWDNETNQIVQLASNFTLGAIEGLFECNIVIVEDVQVTVFGGIELSRFVDGVKTTGDQVLEPGCHRLIRIGTSSKFVIC